MLTKDRIMEILAEHDPMSLCSMGAPDDEYSSEAQLIYDQISNCKHTDGNLVTDFFMSVVHEVFSQQFNWGAREDKVSVFLGDFAGERDDYFEVARHLAYEMSK